MFDLLMSMLFGCTIFCAGFSVGWLCRQSAYEQEWKRNDAVAERLKYIEHHLESIKESMR